MQYIRPTLPLLLLAAWLGSASAQTINNDHLRNSPAVVQAFRDVVAKPSQSAVRVLCNGNETALGAIVDADGWILTKASVLKGKITCKLKDGRTFQAKIVGVTDENEDYDLALLKINATKLQPIEWAPSKEAKVGKWLATVGPGAEPVAIGFVSVGTRKYLKGDQPSKNSNAKSGWLGIALEEAMGGAKITFVFPTSPAEEAGLKVNDIVLEAAGKKIIDSESLINTIQRLKPNESVALLVKRGDEQLDIKAILGKRPADLGENPQETMGSKLSDRRGGFPAILQHDTVLRPSDCGGPLVDLDGKTVGINIARAGRTETYAIPAENIFAGTNSLLARLKTGKLAPKEDVTAEPEVKLFAPILSTTSALVRGDKLDKHRDGKHFTKIHEVKLSADTTYSILLESVDFDTFLILEDAAGKKIAEDDDSGGGTNAQITFRAPKDGTYRIIATSFSDNEIGNYTLTVRKQDESRPRKR